MGLSGLVALSAAANAAVISPGTPVAGISQATLADQWWAEWAPPIPAATNPILDQTGAFAGVNNNGPVFFLAGSGGSGNTTRTINVPAGVPLFFPIVNGSDMELPLGSPGTCVTTSPPSAADSACARAFLHPPLAPSFVPASLTAKLDGVPLDPNLIANAASYYQESAELVATVLPPGNVYGIPATNAWIVQNGYYMAIDGLTPGQHILSFSGDMLYGDGQTVSYGTTDTLNVVPERVSLVSFATGLAALGLVRRRRL
ncbi:MAG: hypothetical protein AB7O80_05655 [Acetobacteraceae bacterium]